MNINKRINQNFSNCILVCVRLSNTSVKAKNLFIGLKNPKLQKTYFVKASKKLKNKNSLVGVGKILAIE